jgi:hypothetical protein
LVGHLGRTLERADRPWVFSEPWQQRLRILGGLRTPF